jgi:hypothetical protein
MATTHTLNSQSYGGRYLQVSLNQTIDTVNNRSLITGTVTSLAGSATWYATGPTTINIGGAQRYYRALESNGTGQSNRNFIGNIDAFYVGHDGNGNLSLGVEIITAIYAAATQSNSNTWTLNGIDRSAPSVGFNTSSITVSSFVLSATSSVTADVWQYSINGGSSWTLFSTSSTTAVSTTISGLSPNTTYSVKVRVRKASNQVYGESGTASIKTLGAATLNSTSTITADNATVSFTVNTTVYQASYTHDMTIRNGSTSILTITGLSWTAGTASRTITLSSSQRTTLLNAMSTIKSFTATLSLVTKSGSTQIGTASEKTCTVQTTAANSNPTFSGFTFVDTRAATNTVTGNNQLMIQNYSQLAITCSVATPKNGASISAYSANCAGVTKTSSGITLSMGTISKSGNQTITVTVTDSRGYSVTSSQTISFLSYADPKISSYNLRRVNEVEDLIQLTFSGQISTITVSGANNNSLKYVRYRYKKTSDTSYGGYYSLLSSVTGTATSFSFSNLELTTLDADFSWDFHIQVRDQLDSLSTYDLYLILPQGTPLISLRPKKVGINTQSPQRALDVIGEVGMNGYNVMGFVTALNGEDFNMLTESGLYMYPNTPASSNSPGTAGLLEVMNAGGYVVQRFTNFSAGNALYVRAFFSGSWSAWSTK